MFLSYLNSTATRTTTATLLKTITQTLQPTITQITPISLSSVTSTSNLNPTETPFHLFFLPNNKTTNFIPKNPFIHSNNDYQSETSQTSLFANLAAFLLVCVVVCTCLWLIYRREVNQQREFEEAVEGRGLLGFAGIENDEAGKRYDASRSEIGSRRMGDVEMGESSKVTCKVNQFGVVEETKEEMDIIEDLRKECMRILEERVQRGEMRVEEDGSWTKLV